jgi:uroporphyrinogen-III decarboxylase
MEVSVKRFRELMAQVRDIEARPSNQEKVQYWQVVEQKDWQPALIRTLPQRKPDQKIPFVVELGLDFWSQLLDFSLVDYYNDPLTYGIANLEMKCFHAKHFKDDTYVDKSYRLLIATTLEGSLMGVPILYTKSGHPWLDYNNPPIQAYEDFENLKIPDFYTSGEMPKIIPFYEAQKEWLDDDFLLKFPDWIMGPFGVAALLRGFDKLLMGLVLEPDFINALLRLIVESRKSFQKQLDAYLGVERTCGLMGNDDVNCPTLSPALYREFLLPLEKELCDYYGSIFYWHSCGNTTKLVSSISEIPHLQLFHCGPWTGVTEACEAFRNKSTALEIMVEPVDKVMMASPQKMEDSLREMVDQIPDGTNCFIKVDSLETDGDLAHDLDVIKTWISTARKVLG